MRTRVTQAVALVLACWVTHASATWSCGDDDNSPAPGSSTATLTVTGDMLAACQIAGDNINFGTFAAMQQGVVEVTGAIRVTCTVGTPYTLALSNPDTTGKLTLLSVSSTTSKLDYQIFQDATRIKPWSSSSSQSGTGTGSAKVHAIYARLNKMQNAIPGAYRGSIVATLTY